MIRGTDGQGTRQSVRSFVSVESDERAGVMDCEIKTVDRVVRRSPTVTGPTLTVISFDRQFSNLVLVHRHTRKVRIGTC